MKQRMELFRNYNDELIYRPSQSFLQKWLRDIHNIHVECYRTAETTTGEKYGFQGQKWGAYTEDLFNYYAKVYEDALDKGLLEALKLIKNDRN